MCSEIRHCLLTESHVIYVPCYPCHRGLWFRNVQDLRQSSGLGPLRLIGRPRRQCLHDVVLLAGKIIYCTVTAVLAAIVVIVIMHIHIPTHTQTHTYRYFNFIHNHTHTQTHTCISAPSRFRMLFTVGSFYYVKLLLLTTVFFSIYAVLSYMLVRSLSPGVSDRLCTIGKPARGLFYILLLHDADISLVCCHH